MPLHAFHRRLSAWALLFPVPNCGSFEVAANNFGRLRRAWPEAVFLSRAVAAELSVPFAQEARMDDYLDGLIKAASGSEQELQDDKVAVALHTMSCPFRAPSYPSAHRRAHDAAVVVSKGLIPTDWCASVVGAPGHFDLSRWFPKRPSWRQDRGIWSEVPYDVTYMAHRLVDDLREVWTHVHPEYHYFLTAGCVNILLTDKIFVWMDEWALRRMASLDLSLMAAGPRGQTMLETYRLMVKAVDVFPWALVVRDVVRRDAQSRQARQVRIQLDDSATYGFVLNHPCRGFDWRPAPGSGLAPSCLLMLDIGVGDVGRGGQGDQSDQGGQGAGHTGLGPSRQDPWARAVATRGGASARVAD